MSHTEGNVGKTLLKLNIEISSMTQIHYNKKQKQNKANRTTSNQEASVLENKMTGIKGTL